MKRHILAILPIALWMGACSDNEAPDHGSDGSNEPLTESAFVCINVMQPPALAGRADDSWSFEQGSDNENEINDIRFYLYDGEGLPISYIDWSEDNTTVTPASPDENVEKTVITAAFKIQWDNSRPPAQLACVVNPTDEIKELGGITLADLSELSADYLTGLTSSNFVMSTSVYAAKEADSEPYHLVNTLKIDKNQLPATLEDALRNPMDMYVERVVARLDISFADEMKDEMIQIKGENGNSLSVSGTTGEGEQTEETETEIYVKFLGWAVTSSPQKSRVLKSVDASWADSDFFSAEVSWNSPEYFRSHWAINPVSLDPDSDYEWFSYSQLVEKEEEKRNPLCHDVDRSNTVTRYIQENASPYTTAATTAAHPKYPTKVIFAAQLVDENGDELSLAEYDGILYRLEDMKQKIAGKLDMFYISESNDEEEVLTPISAEDLDFETSHEHGNEYGPDANDTYYVYFVLSETGEGKKWYKKFDAGADKENYVISEPNAYLDDMLFPAKVWDNGRTYYFFDIPHCQDITSVDPGFYGVVRNNIYNATISGVTSLGTPVYRPEETIYPEKPSPNGNQLIVTVETVEWRLVRQSLQIAW